METVCLGLRERLCAGEAGATTSSRGCCWWFSKAVPCVHGQKAERNIAKPVTASTIEKTRLRTSALERSAMHAPIQAPAACAGAMQAQIARSMLPSWVGAEEWVAVAATNVAGMLTTMPVAAARPTLLCMGSPDSVITTFVRMPPPTPASPEQTPIPKPAK